METALELNKKQHILDNYNKAKKELMAKHYAGESALIIVKELSDLTDQTIKEFARISFPNLNEISIIVLGGYGRRELCFKSDIDISIVYDTEDIESLKVGIENFYYCLLDLNATLDFLQEILKLF